MPQIVMSIQESGNKLDGSVRRAAYAFLEKLSEDDSRPGLHVEPINNSVDHRVRTGRVDQFYRAVMFKVQGQGDEAHYVYLGVWPHDDAISFAQRASLSVNPVNGIAELILANAPAPTEPPPVVAAVTAPSAEPASLLGHLGLSGAELVDKLGLDGELVERAMSARTEDELLDAASTAVEWQGSALVELASGASIHDVKASLMIDAVDIPEAVDEDTRIISALKHPAARMQFSFVEDNEELRRAIEDEDFAAWRVFLHPEQRKYSTQRYSGSFRLSGGAGTGKTVVLLHRARMLHAADPTARIVLTTFTKTLAESMRRDLLALDPEIVLAKALGDPGVFVVGVDAAVSAALKTAAPGELKEPIQRVLGQRTDRIQARNTKSSEQWRDSIDSASSEVPQDLRNAAFFEAEYAMVVLPQRITTREEYFKVRRPGRGVSLNRERRSAVWDVVGAYRASSSVNGAVDFGEAAALAAALLESRSVRPADHVLVDEGQDLNPTQWQFLRALVAEGPDDIFIAEDSHQRIYGQRVVVGRLGIKIVGRSRRLALNYRTTAQNLQFAVGVLEGGEYLDLEDEATAVEGYRSARTGPPPRLVATSSITGELEQSAEIVSDWLEADVAPDTIGILVRDAAQANQISRGLEERGVPVRVITNRTGQSKLPQVMTMHRAKGMEFSRVLIFGADDGLVPASYLLKSVGDSERADALQRERSLFYVAATRARDELVVLWSGDKSAFIRSVDDERHQGEAP
jgi:superfamily I DNA/RNA helicase